MFSLAITKHPRRSIFDDKHTNCLLICVSERCVTGDTNDTTTEVLYCKCVWALECVNCIWWLMDAYLIIVFMIIIIVIPNHTKCISSKCRNDTTTPSLLIVYVYAVSPISCRMYLCLSARPATQIISDYVCIFCIDVLWAHSKYRNSANQVSKICQLTNKTNNQLKLIEPIQSTCEFHETPTKHRISR